MRLPLPGAVRRHWIVSTLSLLILTPILVFFIWTEIALHYTYSSGERAGYLQKISKKGWLCKTWEGEMQLTAIPGSVPEKFIFTVRSDSIAEELNKVNGQRVVLNYA